MAVGVGWLIGYGSAKLIDWMNSTVARNAFTWVIPFATYVLAEEIHASGVIAIVIAANGKQHTLQEQKNRSRFLTPILIGGTPFSFSHTLIDQLTST